MILPHHSHPSNGVTPSDSNSLDGTADLRHRNTQPRQDARADQSRHRLVCPLARRIRRGIWYNIENLKGV